MGFGIYFCRYSIVGRMYVRSIIFDGLLTNIWSLIKIYREMGFVVEYMCGDDCHTLYSAFSASFIVPNSWLGLWILNLTDNWSTHSEGIRVDPFVTSSSLHCYNDTTLRPGRPSGKEWIALHSGVAWFKPPCYQEIKWGNSVVDISKHTHICISTFAF